ncbi:stress-response A/B barrel domain-containing protein UP3 isoform X2 [Salvia miltiorrhiza]|uniref:stress-response A/B barrel domain-containing protein UP3 isoform X2 n=1 Tax=Salvia miltiorrhiza TaxID=226208 RepID=UPI0025AD10DE|nr:stress-response A/B barrel domain-containing protein UP3 isoform X2 [Salvia miltiorrhiza]XP_057764284.1 stress-response A/B barrel domain-containing protein UP3 isoform X2 [Salvia miltiorrhiza]XP_057764293.1 stress-response A/B barrel domain-containing protein UP3 isoform X2 [Salvia miltiorrhiza]XP_057764301.1 stress-response A/B barrel domain-containing protein UP3 isoform X2 [Salvia miltiorrhiza]
MQVLSQIFSPRTLALRHGNGSETLGLSTSHSRSQRRNIWRSGVSSFIDRRGNLSDLTKKERGNVVVSSVEEGISGTGAQRKRKVVEHICLVKAKEDLSEEEEKDMLDFLYTTQYQMRGIVAMSLGRICDQNPEQCTHAIFMRFQTKEDLAKFYENTFYTKVLKEHVMPYCHGFINLDYESEVEDDILPIFRKGEEFNYGVELMLLVEFSQSSLDGPAEDAITSLANLTVEFPSLIVQATKGANMNMNNVEYTHGVVVRFRSVEAFKIFMSSSEYNTIWESKFMPFIRKVLCVHFSVDPVGKELM